MRYGKCFRKLFFLVWFDPWQRYNFMQRFRISPTVLMAYADIIEEHYQIVSEHLNFN